MEAVSDFVADYMSRPGVPLLAFIVCVVVACGALVGVWMTLRRGAKVRCNWKKDAEQPEGGMTRWVCSICSGVSFSADNEPPRNCRALDPRAKTF